MTYVMQTTDQQPPADYDQHIKKERFNIMKKLLVLGCGLFLLSICTFNNNLNDNELIFSTIEENSKEIRRPG